MDYKQLFDLAAKQYGIFTTKQALASIGRSRLRTGLEKGMFERVGEGTYRVTSTPVSWMSQLSAATLGINGAVVSHRSAARLWGMGFLTNRVEVTVGARQSRRSSLADVHLTRGALQLALHKGLPVTTVERTLIDISGRTSVERLRLAVSRCLLDDLATRASIQECIDRTSTRGRGKISWLREIVDGLSEADEKATTDLEAELLVNLRAKGLPDPTAQHRVITQNGPYWFDFAYIDIKLAIETDGREHLTMNQIVHDKSRDADTAALGWQTMRFQKGSSMPRFMANVVSAYERRHVELTAESAS